MGGQPVAQVGVEVRDNSGGLSEEFPALLRELDHLHPPIGVAAASTHRSTVGELINQCDHETGSHAQPLGDLLLRTAFTITQDREEPDLLVAQSGRRNAGGELLRDPRTEDAESDTARMEHLTAVVICHTRTVAFENHSLLNDWIVNDMLWWLSLLNSLAALASLGFAVGAVIRPQLLAPPRNTHDASRFFASMYAVRAVPLSIAVVVAVWTHSQPAAAAVLAVAAAAQAGDAAIGLTYKQWGMVAGATVAIVCHLAGLVALA